MVDEDVGTVFDFRIIFDVVFDIVFEFAFSFSFVFGTACCSVFFAVVLDAVDFFRGVVLTADLGADFGLALEAALRATPVGKGFLAVALNFGFLAAFLSAGTSSS